MHKISDDVIKFIEKKNMKNWRVDNRRKMLSWGENPERGLPGMYAITITICNSDDATESHT